MAGETVITLIGNLTADPELRNTQSGASVVNFTIASTPRNFDRTANEWKDGEALFLRCNAWRELADHIAATLTKGMRVVAQGRLQMRSYTDKDNNPRTSWELEIDEIGPSLKYATAQVTRVASGQNAGGQQQPQSQQQYGAPQTGAPQYGAPQQGGYQQPQQGGYQQPQGQAPQQPQQPQQGGYQQQPQQMQQPQGQPAPQQPQQQAAPQQQAQQPPQGAYPQPGQQWAQPGSFGDDTPF